jgi:hypothetical protein
MNQVQGQTTIKKLNLTNVKGNATFELEEIFLGISIFEDIFLPFKTGKLILQDTNDLQATLPIIGGENLEVMYYTDNDTKPKVYQFEVYKLDKDVRTTEKGESVKVIVLYFAAKEQLLDTRTSVSKHFDNKAENTIQSILSNFLRSNKSLVVDNTDESVSFVANFWTPSKIFAFLSRSVTSGNFSDFAFFEDKEGFNFKSITKLMEQTPSHELVFEDALETKYNFNMIQRFTMSKYFDLIKTASIGGLGNTVFKFDNEKYSFTKEEEDFESITQYGTSLGRNVQFAENMLSNNGVITTFKDNRHIAKRDQFLKALDKYHMVIQLTGDSTKTIGQVYNIEVEKKIRELSEENELLTGRWLVTQVKHEIASSGIYTQNIKCVKNAFFKSNDTNNVKGKKNV